MSQAQEKAEWDPPTITILLKLGLFLLHFLTLSCTSVIPPSNSSSNDDNDDDVVVAAVDDDDTSEEMITHNNLIIEGFDTKIWLFLVTPRRQHDMSCVNGHFWSSLDTDNFP